MEDWLSVELRNFAYILSMGGKVIGNFERLYDLHFQVTEIALPYQQESKEAVDKRLHTKLWPHVRCMHFPAASRSPACLYTRILHGEPRSIPRFVVSVGNITTWYCMITQYLGSTGAEEGQRSGQWRLVDYMWCFRTQARGQRSDLPATYWGITQPCFVRCQIAMQGGHE